MKQYFYITTHFLPKYDGVVFTLYGNNIYEKIETGEKFRKRLLYDFGWGQEYGFELLPQLPFDSLIKLIEYPKEYLQKKFYKTYCFIIFLISKSAKTSKTFLLAPKKPEPREKFPEESLIDHTKKYYVIIRNGIELRQK